MREIVAESMAPFAARLPGGLRQPRLLGTSGTVTTLARVHLKLDRYDRSAVDGLLVPAASMCRISADLSGMSLAVRARVACIGPARADLVLEGCVLLLRVLDLCPADRPGAWSRCGFG